MLAGASRGAVLVVVCPHCEVRQTRARIGEGSEYTCKSCGRPFTREDGLRVAKERDTRADRPAGRRRDR